MDDTYTSTVKAGRLMQMFGWVNLFFTLAAAVLLVMPGATHDDIVIVWDPLVLAWAVVVSLVYIAVGASVKLHRRWARIAGAGLAAYGLLSVPIGTLIGGGVLVYLIRGWKEAAPELAARPA